MQYEALPSTIELQELAVDQERVARSDIIRTSYDRGEWTYRCCLAGLACSYAVGIVCIILASGVLGHPKFDEEHSDPQHHWPEVNISPIAGEILPLAINVVITALIEATGLIHATTLRWALGRRLTFNSNLRLFASARGSFALGPVANIIHAALSIMAYTATSLLFPISPPREFCEVHSDLQDNVDCTGSVNLSPPSFAFLAASLLGQAILATWQIASVKVPTWSACPLDTAWASVERGTLVRRAGRCLASVHETAFPTVPHQPKTQKSAYAAHKQVRRILWYTVTTAIGGIIWFAVLFSVIRNKTHRFGQYCNDCGIYEGSNWNLIPDQGGTATSTAIIAEYTPNFFIGMFFLIYIFQAFLTMALYCAELITNLSRDEVTWRRCNTQTQYMARPNAILRAASSWAAVTLFVLKAVLHWLFGKAMTYAYNWGIFMRTPQLLYLSIGTMTLVAFVMYLALERPKGPQPSTYGHLQTIVDLVDDWHIMMFWGDKGLQSDGIRHAGTSDMPLGKILMDAYYSGSA